MESNETLFSWSGRYHRRSGNSRTEITSRVLFGHPRAGTHHDFPSHVAHFARCIGVPDAGRELILHHTALGILAKFLDAETVDVASSMMLGASIAQLRQTLGLLKSGIGRTLPLKTCIECIAADMQMPSGPIWHLEHQWPSVWVCPVHFTPLVYLIQQASRSSTLRWLLPDNVAKTEWIHPPSLSEHQIARLHRLARLTAGVAKLSETSLDQPSLRLAYLLAAKDLGFVVTSDGSLRFRQLVQALQDHTSSLVGLPGWDFVSEIDSAHGGFLGLLLRRFPGNRHLNKHLILIDFLFGSCENFHSKYDLVKAAAVAGTIDELEGELYATRRAVLQQVKIGGSSVSRAADAAGVSAAQAVKWVRKAGIPYVARPRVLNSEKEKVLLELLSEGHSCELISEKLEIKRGWLRNYLAHHPALRHQWNSAQDRFRRERYRSHFLSLLEEHPGVPVKRVRAIPGSGYSWLYNHDRVWLMENLPRVK